MWLFKIKGENFMAKRNNLFAKLIQEAKERLREGNYREQDLKQRVKRHLMYEENKRKNASYLCRCFRCYGNSDYTLYCC